ncbi:uncharacterized protein LOC135384930 [Ornithodoros turicata]|uniref:uncharacterized protein LOC135384930 n=1 Tax=Ornithodoros turicata TaxID=34597 RepID=UPI003139F4C5
METPTHQAWHEWVHGLPALSTMQAQRSPFNPAGTVPDLHIFADASPRAYGAVAYVRTYKAPGGVSSHLLIAKGRIAPLKTVTLPRLELLVCLLAARLFKSICDVIPALQSRVTLWTDSQIALHWIKNGKMTQSQNPQFVEGRSREVRQLTDPARWCHCDAKSNPADLLTRGITATELLHSKLL